MKRPQAKDALPSDPSYRSTSSLALLTDLYQLTMAFGYWRHGRHQQQAVFHLFFREAPFDGGYAVACGLAQAIELLDDWRFDDAALAYLQGLCGADGAPLFSDDFLRYLAQTPLQCDIDAVPEGTVVFPHTPLLRVRGPMLQCQLLETALLNIVNFQTLAASKAARICDAARGEPVLEFGLRRAQGIDGALSASRAAYVGGCAATSNVLAGQRFGIPVRGTHAHSWVMSFEDELASFRAYAEAMPGNCVFLVDTYDTLEGVRRAVQVGEELRARGHRLLGVRLDSGDLAELSVRAREILDAAGFEDASIVASNDLDEYRIEAAKEAGARIAIWGVGTRLATAYDQPALGGVYKLGAVDDGRGGFRHTIKLSENPVKISVPGQQQLRRFVDAEGRFAADGIWDELEAPDADAEQRLYAREDGRELGRFAAGSGEDLLQPIYRAGARCYEPPAAAEARERTLAQLAQLPDSVRRLRDPEPYPVGLESGLHARRAALIAAAREG